jgi:hypothetical protein
VVLCDEPSIAALAQHMALIRTELEEVLPKHGMRVTVRPRAMAGTVTRSRSFLSTTPFSDLQRSKTPRPTEDARDPRASGPRLR